MSSTLTKIELQEMLREMGVPFSHEENYESLLKMFKEENHRRWMASVSGVGLASKLGQGRNRIRRRRGVITQPVIPPSIHTDRNSSLTKFGSDKPFKEKAGISKHLPIETVIKRKETVKDRIAEKKEDSSSLKEVFTKQPVAIDDDALKRFENQLLKRAREACELCFLPLHKSGDGELTDFSIYHFTSPVERGSSTLRNAVILCSDCHSQITSDPSKVILSTLKKKARSRVLPPLVVVKKK